MALDPPAPLRRLAGALPPPLRRTLSGLWLDVTGLPARLADPARRGDPWQTLHNVGGGDYRAAGDGVVALLRERAGLQPHHAVLDIGCGTGRVAEPLARFLSDRGAYTGFDVSRAAVGACRRRFAQARPDFRFVYADLRNAEYSARGAGEETSYRFPLGESAIDVAFATSVFTHMQAPGVAAYLCEAARVLRPGGRLLFTAYALTPQRRAAAGLHDFGPVSQVLDPRAPERLIAHDADLLETSVAQAGLRRVAREFGVWAPGASYGDRQDLYVVEKA